MFSNQYKCESDLIWMKVNRFSAFAYTKTTKVEWLRERMKLLESS